MSWIAIKDEQPKETGLYLVFAPSADPDLPFRHVGWWELRTGQWSLLPQMWIDAITHWFPFPDAPKEQINAV